MRFGNVVLSILLLLMGIHTLRAQSSICDAWAGLMAARATGFMYITGEQYKEESTQTVFKSTIRLGESWDGVYVNRTTGKDTRRFEAIMGGFMAKWAADTFLNRELRKLQTCLHGYTFLKDPVLSVDGTTYFITDAAGTASRRAVATIGYRHLKYDVYEAVFCIRSKEQAEPIPQQAVTVFAVAAKPSAGSSSAINKEEFTRKLREVLIHAQTDFTAIKGAEVVGRTFPTNEATIKLPGAERVAILNVGVGMDYEAYYGYQIGRAEADRIFDELRKLLIAALPAGYKDEGIVHKTPGKNNSFVNAADNLEVEIRLSDMSVAKNEYNVRLYVSQRLF